VVVPSPVNASIILGSKILGSSSLEDDIVRHKFILGSHIVSPLPSTMELSAAFTNIAWSLNPLLFCI
jgi:hypothetical protein